MLQQNKEKCLFDVFLSWKNYSANLKQLRVKVATYQAQSIERDKQRVVQKWQRRRLVTQKFSHQQQKIDRVYDRNLVVTVFRAWQDHNYMNKRLSYSLRSMASIVDKVFTKSALERIRLESERRQFQMERSKVRGTEKLFESLAFITTKRKSQVVNELKQFGVLQKKNFKGLQSVLKYQLTRGLRDMFNRWREESERKAVVKFMNEEGPVAVQNHILKKMIYNLKTKVREEGFAPREIIDMLLHSRRQSMQSMEKSICRLVSYKDNQLYLLPKCIDQWKKWVQMRKLYRYWLDYLDNKIDVKRSPMFWAFQKWKHGELERRLQLSKLKKAKLLQISCKNEEKMHDLLQNLEQADMASDELTEQRDLLLQRYVGSQRLALAVINGQNEIAKQKAIARWANTNQQAVQEDYEDALKENLRRIQALKDRIKHLEVSNNEIADQNEDLRQGALDGIEMAKQIDDLNRDREKLSVDLADKAITIKKLLEDNNNLSIRLGNAQEEAQNLIRMSQMKLQESSNRYKRSGADNNRFASPQYDYDY